MKNKESLDATKQTSNHSLREIRDLTNMFPDVSYCTYRQLSWSDATKESGSIITANNGDKIKYTFLLFDSKDQLIMPVSSGRTMRGIALNDRNPAISKVGYVLKITEKRGCCKIPQLQWLIKFFNSKLRWQKIRVEMLHTDNKPFREFVKGLKISKEALLIN